MPMVSCRRPAMATLFEVWLVGEDEEHLTAVGEAILDEVRRVESVLSRFDPSAELVGVNRFAASRPVKVSIELFTVLQDCQHRCKATNGYFDPCVSETRGRSFVESVHLYEPRRSVRFLHPDTQLDLGGYGKGYALDSAMPLLKEFGVTSALLHGGTSSILAVGTSEDGHPWSVGMGDPFDQAPHEMLCTIPLVGGFSTSAIMGDEKAEIVDPSRAGHPQKRACCIVTTPTALEAEVLSTALLAMGREVAIEYAKSRSFSSGIRIGWIERIAELPFLEWIVRQDDADTTRSP